MKPFPYFGIYFSNYFRKTYGQLYRDYAQQYKLNLIESRLMTFNSNMKEIAKEFGFHDLNHFYVCGFLIIFKSF